MKAFVVCAALLVSACQAEVSPKLMKAALRAKWTSYKAAHKKSYSAAEESLRMANYLDNTRVIEEHNARFHQGLESYELGHNELSDLTLEEIKSTRMGLVLPPNAAEIAANASRHFAPSDIVAPGSVDWRSKRCVQYVKNQGSCGSCYSFSALGALETSYCNKHGQLPDLAEQHLVDCAGRGCSGGWMHDMFNYLQSNGGAIDQRRYPYTGKVEQCKQDRMPKAAGVATYKQISRGNENELMQAIATVGTVSIAYNAGTQQHSYYRGGILDVPNCGNTPTHAVLLVGYGTENGKDFWTLKNSWGEGWGERGFFRLARGKNMCGIADWASYPTAA
ncbi:cathepsin L1 [Galendromus occidentalis]|uniref:Cathepsin L1 n=1 Tax=Galendromus occidentalis TaxID=34638 RepID=A0AAJ6QRF0_9ACAR|nr:cathepsin L1 [Galendromus occidentalis]